MEQDMFTKLTPLEYLQCEIACKHDKKFEKETWADRLAHFKTLDLDDRKMIKTSSNPIGLKAAIIGYHQAVAGDPTGYMISLDACSSGLQILSLLVSCPTSFDLCGGNAEKCVDSYTTIYEAMGLNGRLSRKDVKQAIMTSLYGSVATPEAVFGDHIENFYQTMEKMAPGAWDLNQGLQDLWTMFTSSDYSWVLPDNFHAYIETKKSELIPFSFLDTTYKMVKKIDGRPDFHKGLGPNMIHSVDGFIVREMFRRCSYDPKAIQRVKDLIAVGMYGSVMKTTGRSSFIVQTLWGHYKKTGFLSTRIFDYLFHDTMGFVDPQVIFDLIETLPAKPFQMVSVHDCFRVHPNYGNDLRRQYQHILADLNDSTLLTSMCSQVAGKRIPIKKVGKLTRQTILDSNYCLA
jgi:hypothetical protein